MKKLFTLVMGLLLAGSTIAQTNTNAKLNLVVGHFTGDYSKAQRENVIDELAKSHRANVIEKDIYDALPQEVRAKMHVDAVLTAKCTLTTEKKETSRTQKDGTKKTVVNYVSKMTTQMTFSDPATGKTLLEPEFTSEKTDEDRSKSINEAIEVGHTRGKKLALILYQTLSLDEYLQEKYPMRGEIVTMDEAEKNKAKVVTINLGGRDAIYRGQTFEVVGEKKNYGKLRVREINSDTMATCSVEEKGKDIYKAIEAGTTIQVVSYVQTMSLNGLVRVEQEAPRLTATSPDESKKRNVAFGGMFGGAPDNFTTAVKKALGENLRVNNMSLDGNLSKLDGIVYGLYSGMHTSSRLVKAEEHLLQMKDYTEYTTTVDWYLFIVNPQTGEIAYAGNQGTSSISDKSQDEATERAIKAAANITSATYSAYPLIGSIKTVDEFDQKKAKEVSIDLGSNYPVHTGLRFDVYSQDANSDWEKIGRIEVKSVVDGETASCTVKKGGKEINAAMEQNLPIRITTFILKEFFDL